MELQLSVSRMFSEAAWAPAYWRNGVISVMYNNDVIMKMKEWHHVSGFSLLQLGTCSFSKILLKNKRVLFIFKYKCFILEDQNGIKYKIIIKCYSL